MTKVRFLYLIILVPIIFLLAILSACTLEQLYGPYSGFQLGDIPRSANGPTLAEQLGFTKESIIVIVHADDIGMHIDQTDGSFETMRYGMVKTGSVMVPCPDFDRTAKIWAKNPNLDLGVHLTLNSDWGEKYGWGGVLPKSKVPSLYNSKGIMWRKPYKLMANMDVEEALMEIEAQILKAFKAGLKPTHIDGHYGNYYMSYDLAVGVKKLSRKYNLPMKPHHKLRKEMREQGYVFPDTCWMFLILYGEWIQPEIRKKVYDNWLKNLKPGVHELLIHPSLMGEEWANILGRPNSYLRLGDYKYWTSPETMDLANELGITFMGYRELQKLQAKNWGLETDRVHFEK
jgi:predicted glycoside hydrolase/deacetylase ChbG (UPF0249 family)